MPDVSSIAPADVERWIVFDMHKNSLVAGVLPASGGTPEVTRLENTERAVRRFVDRLGGPRRLGRRLRGGPVRLRPVAAAVAGRRRLRRDRAVAGAGPGRRPGQDRPPRRQEAGAPLPRRRAVVRRAALARAGGAARPGALPRRPAPGAHRGAPPRRQAAAAPRAHLPRGQEGLDQAAPGLAFAPAAGRPARPARARAYARSPRRRRRPARRDRPRARAGRDHRAVVPTRCAGCARSAASGSSRRSGCWPRSATSAASPTRAS